MDKPQPKREFTLDQANSSAQWRKICLYASRDVLDDLRGFGEITRYAVAGNYYQLIVDTDHDYQEVMGYLERYGLMSEDTIALTFSREELGKVRLGLEEVERGYIASVKVCIPGGPAQQRFQAGLEIIQNALRKVNDALGTRRYPRMTDHHKGYIVVLDQSIREDEAEATINALRMVKGVIRVTPIVEDVGSMVEEMRVRNTVRASLFQWIRENL